MRIEYDNKERDAILKELTDLKWALNELPDMFSRYCYNYDYRDQFHEDLKKFPEAIDRIKGIFTYGL